MSSPLGTRPPSPAGHLVGADSIVSDIATMSVESEQLRLWKTRRGRQGAVADPGSDRGEEDIVGTVLLLGSVTLC